MTIYEYGNPEAEVVLIQPVGDHDLPEIENEVMEIGKLVNEDFQFIAVKVDSWNQELTPWKAPAVFGNENFGDGAWQTLKEILKICTDKNKIYYSWRLFPFRAFCIMGIVSNGYILWCGSSLSFCLVSWIC